MEFRYSVWMLMVLTAMLSFPLLAPARHTEGTAGNTVLAQADSRPSRRCSKCGAPVPESAKLGDKCPNCGTVWEKEISEFEHAMQSIREQQETRDQIIQFVTILTIATIAVLGVLYKINKELVLKQANSFG